MENSRKGQKRCSNQHDVLIWRVMGFMGLLKTKEHRSRLRVPFSPAEDSHTESNYQAPVVCDGVAETADNVPARERRQTISKFMKYQDGLSSNPYRAKLCQTKHT